MQPIWQADYLVACVQLQRTQVIGRIRREDSEPDAGAAAIKAQFMLRPGKFRIMLDKLACQLLVIDEPVEEGVPVRPPPSFTPRPSAFFDRKVGKVVSEKGRLAPAKEREANEKAKLVSTTTQWAPIRE